MDSYKNILAKDIAIIGISCRFPQADNLEEFWQKLKNGAECISFNSTTLSTIPSKTNFVRARGIIKDIDFFDASFFDISTREAELLDPQHRLFLECAWQALENAGYDVASYEKTISVYAACGVNTYLSLIEACLNSPSEKFQALVSNVADCLPSKVSYKLNLRGESIAVQTACSSSLVAVHMACQSLLNGYSDMALAGGVNIATLQNFSGEYQEGMIYSPDGHCRAFDHMAKGMVEGDGLGIVVLKRLDDALQEEDYIYAVIKGSAINNDGSSKVGYTAPSVAGQAEVIATSLAIANIPAETIGYVEAHGTGTSLGDPIEIEALTQAFRLYTSKKGFCAVGSVKTNIGHLIHAAGIAGLIKAVLSIQHGVIPSTLHFEKPNPQIDFDNSPFYVNNYLQEWSNSLKPHRAGVSSFGIGGTNAHVILEEAPIAEASSPSRPWHLLVLSAKTSSALDTATTNLAEHLKRHRDLNLADVAYTLQVGRAAFNHRRMIVCNNLNDAVMNLETLNAQRVFTTFHESKKQPLVFMFPGQGAQYVNMGLELYQVEPKFREQVDICSELLYPHLGFDLRKVLYPSEEHRERSEQQLKQTAITQPALFVIEYALAQLWKQWGVHPQAMIGHSIGEYVAACIAGVFSLEDALSLVAVRGQLMQQLPSGTMLSVHLPEKEIETLLGRKLSLAAINGLSLCVVSGVTDAVEQLEGQLVEKGVVCRRLHTSHAFHSEMMSPILERFTQQVQKVNLKPPKIPYVSNVTGNWITVAEAITPDYWTRHLRQTVRFASGLQQFLKEPNLILLEVGPNKTLNTLVKKHPDKTVEQLVLSSLGHVNDRDTDVASLLNTLGQLWLADVKVDWSSFYAHERHHRIPLPSYPFERKRYWIEPQKQADNVNTRQIKLCKQPDIKDWFYVPSWKRTKLPIPYQSGDIVKGKGKWLLFIENNYFGEATTEIFTQEDLSIVRIVPGDCFKILDDSTYQINPLAPKDYLKLIDSVTTNEGSIKTIIHLWNYTPANSAIPDSEQALYRGFYSLLFLTQALDNICHQLPIWVVTSNAQPIKPTNNYMAVEKSTLLGLCKVIPQEYPNLICRTLDFSYGDTANSNRIRQHLEQLISEISDPSADLEVAYRERDRWVPVLEPINVPAQQNNCRLRHRGIYLITGGLGQIGLTIAEYLAQHFQAKLVLISRSGLPPEDTWSNWIANHDEEDTVSQKILKVWQFQKLGAEVLIPKVDVTDINQMSKLRQEIQNRWGTLHGVIHAAGVVGKQHLCSIGNTTPENAAKVFEPKIRGTLVLYEVLKNEPLDFCLLCSSLSSFLGGLTYCVDTAANRFMDVFTQFICNANCPSWISINWDIWQSSSFVQPEIGSDTSNLAINPYEGVEVFARSLSLQYDQLIVSTVPLTDRVEDINQFFSHLPASKVTQDSTTDSSNHFLSLPTCSKNDVEKLVTGIFKNLLGINNISLHEDFLTLGGDSLMMLDVIDQIEQALDVQIPFDEAFDALTVSQLTDLSLRRLAEKTPFTSTEMVEEDYYCYEIEIDGEIATVITKKHDYLEQGLPQGTKNFRPYNK